MYNDDKSGNNLPKRGKTWIKGWDSLFKIEHNDK